MSTINFAGLASGIDTNALIDATSAATRKQEVTPKTTKVDELTKQDTAFDSLKTKLDDLKTLAEGMGTINGGGVVKSATSSSETVATATVQNGALNGNYALTVSQMARGASYSFNYPYTGSSDTISNTNGTITFSIGNTNTETVAIAVTTTTTVSDFVTAYNNASSKSQASLVQVSSGDYRILITSDNTGTDSGSISASGLVDTKLNTASVTNNAAQNAIFTVNGIGPFTRQSNSVNDIFTGLAFNLVSVGSTNVIVQNDPDGSYAGMKKFIDQYNSIISFLATNNTITRDESGGQVNNIFAALANTSTDDTAISTVKNAMSGLSYSGTSQIKILADLGIQTQQDGTLYLNEDKFKTAISTDATAVTSLTQQLGDTLGFTYNASTGGGIIDFITGYNRLIETSQNSNKNLISSLNTQISEAEDRISKTEASLKAQYARLEATMSRMQGQQQALSSALRGL